MQLLVIAGNVGKDAVLRTTQNGDKVLGFSLAVDNGKDKPATWYDCSIWGKRAESLERHITKGLKLSLSGRPSAREHDGKAYLGISVDNLTFMGGGQQREERSGSGEAYGQGAYGGGYGQQQSRDDGDFIPF